MNVSSIDWIALHQVQVMTPCVNDVIQPQIDKYASCGKLCVLRRVVQMMEKKKKKRTLGQNQTNLIFLI